MARSLHQSNVYSILFSPIFTRKIVDFMVLDDMNLSLHINEKLYSFDNQFLFGKSFFFPVFLLEE